MKLLPSTAIISSFATTEKHKHKRNRRDILMWRHDTPLRLVAWGFAAIITIVHPTFACYYRYINAITTYVRNTTLSIHIITTCSMVAFIFVISFAPSFSSSSYYCCRWLLVLLHVCVVVVTTCRCVLMLQVIVGIVVGVCCCDLSLWFLV